MATDLCGRRLAAPVFYPGAIERTSVAERDEDKGFLTLDIDAESANGGRLRDWSFHRLPARPMMDIELDDPDRERLVDRLKTRLAAIDPEVVVRVRLGGAALTAAEVRSLAPPTMTVDLRRPRSGTLR